MDPITFCEQHDLNGVIGQIGALINTALAAQVQEANYELKMRGDQLVLFVSAPSVSKRRLQAALAECFGRMGGQQLLDKHDGLIAVELA